MIRSMYKTNQVMDKWKRNKMRLGELDDRRLVIAGVGYQVSIWNLGGMLTVLDIFPLLFYMTKGANREDVSIKLEGRETELSELIEGKMIALNIISEEVQETEWHGMKDEGQNDWGKSEWEAIRGWYKQPLFEEEAEQYRDLSLIHI